MMTDKKTFYGFPRCNTGVMPECAKHMKVFIIWEAFPGKGVKCSSSPLNVNDKRTWLPAPFGGRTLIYAYIPTDIPLEAL